MNNSTNLITESKLDYNNLIREYPWIVDKGKFAILSPDSDGILCGLFMSHFFDWKIVGYYDGKILLLKNGLECEDCIFLDVDIYREKIKSIGHHMVLLNKDRIPDNWNNFKSCIQPNNMRGLDFKHSFKRKYPLGTIHLLLGIADNKVEINISKSSLCPLYFVDGTYQVLYTYPENVLDWLDFLNANNSNSVLYKVFCNAHYSVHDMMTAMDGFFRKRDKICPPRGGKKRERGDRLVLSDENGPMNIYKKGNFYAIEKDAKDKIEQFIILISNLTNWNYKKTDWIWDDFLLYGFNKGIKKPLVRDYYHVLSSNPFSFAITAADRFEYTLLNPQESSSMFLSHSE